MTMVETTLAFSTKKFALQALLERSSVVLPSKDIIPVLKNFQIEASDAGLRVIATDLELTMLSTSALATVTTPGVAVFPGMRLLAICREAADSDVEVDVSDLTAHITIGRAQWSLKLKDASEYPELPDISEIQFHSIDRDEFLQGIRSVAKAAARESTRANLMMLDINAGRMRASDGIRFQQASLPSWPKGFNVQIPISAVDDLAKLLREVDVSEFELGESDTHLVFRVNDDVFMSNKLVVSFPPVDKTLLSPWLTNDQELRLDRSDLSSAIKRVRIASDPETPAVVLELEDDCLTVKSQDKYGSTAEEAIDVTWTGQPRRVAFNSQQLLDMLSMTTAQSISFFLGEGKKAKPSPLLLRDADAGLIGVLNQMRTDWIS